MAAFLRFSLLFCIYCLNAIDAHIQHFGNVWCQAQRGHCFGERRSFREKVLPTLQGQRYRCLRFVDWDQDGDTDVLVGAGPGETIWFHERLSNESFIPHQLLHLPKRGPEIPKGYLDSWPVGKRDQVWDEYLNSTFRFDVADWDGDGELDLLLCTLVDDLVRVSVLDHSLLPAESGETGEVILLTNGSACDLLAVDFDEDGDVDVILGRDKYQPTYSRYFERISDGQIVERNENQNPLEFFEEDIKVIADLDGDGQLEIITSWYSDFGNTLLTQRTYFRVFRRALDGSFVEAVDKPFLNMQYFSHVNDYRFDVFVADWNSDGLPDVLTVSVSPIHSVRGPPSFSLDRCLQQLRDLDLVRNSQISTYEDIQGEDRLQVVVVDWNHDGLEDILTVQNDPEVSRLRLYEFRGEDMREVFGVFENISNSLAIGFEQHMSVAIGDWDLDGDLDLLIASTKDRKLHYHEMVSGRFQKERPHHPFSNIRLNITYLHSYISYPLKSCLPSMVDFDGDGDMDLFLGPPDGRYFEQLANGTLREYPLEQSPVKSVLMKQPSEGNDEDLTWQFVDCDDDGDADLIRLAPWTDPPVQACEHDDLSHALQCRPDFLCKGANLSRFNRSGPLAQLGPPRNLDLGFVADGRLKLIARHSGNLMLWSSGFCVPAEPCNSRGMCPPRHNLCSCVVGRELRDCSGCQPNFYSINPKLRHLHDCEACPGVNGQVCYGRGSCMDDVTAKALATESTAALMATGNGSCSCNEHHFFGSDDHGRSTCVEGVCPAGSEEDDNGNCNPCPAGSFSSAGGFCKECGPATFSLAGSGSCSVCLPGTFSKESGASACQSCAPGTYAEEGSARCTSCPPGSISSVSGSGSCSQCPQGKYEVANQVCSDCDVGTYAKEGSARCSQCPPGSVSDPNGGSCVQCAPGSVSSADALYCQVCEAGRYEVRNQVCIACPSGSISPPQQRSCTTCPAGRFAQTSLTCEPCFGGTFAPNGSSACKPCPTGHVSGPNSAACRSCDSLLIQAIPDPTKQSCQVPTMDLVFALIALITSTCLGVLVFTGLLGRIPIADVSARGEKIVVTTSVAHFLLERACPAVALTGTEIPDLERSNNFTVKALSMYQLTLQSEQSDNNKPLDTSMGHLHLKFPHAFCSAGLWRCPLIWWCLLFLAATVGAVSQLNWCLELLACGLGLCTGALAFAWRFRQGESTKMVKRRRQFLKAWPLALEKCCRGPDRSITAGKLQDFLRYFESFIRERSMYYVCSNIVKPLTQPYQLSFAELIGPTEIQWFVSHYWGMSVRHLSDAICKHAEGCDGDWRDSAYWICTFSNNQWLVKNELGDGRWQESSFYLALTSPQCKGTAMIIDESVSPLQRVWCLFEVYQTICLSRSEHFQGLLLCASTGVLQQGKAGTDVAVAVAKKVAELDTRGAQASDETDRQMIHSLIEQMPGGFDTMNRFVRDTICNALWASHVHYEGIFKSLMYDLTSEVSATLPAPLPTILTSTPQQSRTVDNKQ